MNHAQVHVPYHQQDADRGCSAAVAQMLLQSISQTVSDQDDLVGTIDTACNTTLGVGCANGVAHVLNVPDGTLVFAVNADSDFVTGCRRIAHSLRNARVAVPAVVQNGHHWVLVYGVDFDPSVVPDITAFWFNDPEPKTASQVVSPEPRPQRPPAPPPHAAGDMCGTGSPKENNGTWDFGSPATMATLNGWQTFWWLNGSSDPPSFVTVTADAAFPDVVAPAAVLMAADMGPVPSPAPGGGDVAANDNTMIGRDDAQRAALRGLAMIPENSPLAPALHCAKPDDVVRVWRLDVPGDAYDLVTMTGARAEPVALVTIDARTGAFLGVQAFPPESISSLIPLDAAWEIFEAYRDPDREHGGAYALLRKTERYVWRPGRASRSPYAPLVEYTDGSMTYYVAHDGNVYPDVSERDYGDGRVDRDDRDDRDDATSDEV